MWRWWLSMFTWLLIVTCYVQYPNIQYPTQVRESASSEWSLFWRICGKCGFYCCFRKTFLTCQDQRFPSKNIVARWDDRLPAFFNRPNNIFEKSHIISMFNLIYLLPKCRLLQESFCSRIAAISEDSARGPSAHDPKVLVHLVLGRAKRYYFKISGIAQCTWLPWWCLNRTLWWLTSLTSIPPSSAVSRWYWSGQTVYVSAPVLQAQAYFVYLTPCFPLGSTPYFFFFFQFI